MKFKQVNRLLAATTFGVVFANASLAANAEELADEIVVISEEDSGQEAVSLPESGEEQPEAEYDEQSKFIEETVEVQSTEQADNAGAEEEDKTQLPDLSGTEGKDEMQSSDLPGTEGEDEPQSPDLSGTEGEDEPQSPDLSGTEGKDETQSPDSSEENGSDEEPSGSESDESQEKGPANFEEAKENLDQAKEEEAQAKAELDGAQSEADNAQADVDQSRQEVQEAEAELDQAQEKKEEAETQKKEADEEADRAGQELEAAKEKLDQALQDANADKEAYEKVQQELEEKKEQQETARQEAEEAKADYNEKASEAQEAAAETQEAENAVESAQKEKDTADQAVADAQKKADSAQEAYDHIMDETGADAAAIDAAQQNLDQAKVRLDAVVEKVESGSLGFFQYLNREGSDSAAAAVTILTAANESGVPGLRDYEPWAAGSWEEFISYTHLGDENDATSLENMKKTIEFIKECNELRKQDNNFSGNGDLLVNDALMAIAQLNANWATMIENSDKLIYNSHSKVFNVGENLAWYPVSGDPFQGWYFEEKGLYDKGERDHSKVGHYLNITDWQYTATGYAINFSQTSTQMWQNCAQEFSIGTTNLGFGISYSVSEYEERFMAYYDSVIKELSDARAAYDAAKAAYDQAIGSAENQAVINAKKAELDKAMAELENAKENAQAKMEILNSAQEALAVSNERNEAAQAACERSRETLEAAQRNLQEKEEAYAAVLENIKTSYSPEVAQAAESCANFKLIYEQAVTVQEKAAKELGSAEMALAAAMDRKSLADQKLQEKTDLLTQKLQALQDAKNAYNEALANLAIAQADYDRLKPQEKDDSSSDLHAVTQGHGNSESSSSEEGAAQENRENVIVSNLSAGNSRKATFLKGCSFNYFLSYSSSFMKECPLDNLTIDCSDTPWFSFNKKTLEALKSSSHKSLTIIFRYKGRKYVFTIPSDYDLNLLQDSEGWYGFMYLKMIFDGYELV